MEQELSKIKKLTISAVFLSMALVMKYFSFDLPLFGASGIRVGFAEIFTVFPALLFGPFYGAVVAGLNDVLGHLIKPMGAYMPLITATAILGGFMRGYFWRIMRNISCKKLRIFLLVIALTALIVGIYNMYALKLDGVHSSVYEETNDIDTDGFRYISSLLIKGSMTRSNPTGILTGYIIVTTWALIAFGILCLLFIAVDILLAKYNAARTVYSTQILATMLIAGITVNSLNTVILREFLFPAWKLLPFTALWLPRLSEVILISCINSFFVALLYPLCLTRGRTSDIECEKL